MQEFQIPSIFSHLPAFLLDENGVISCWNEACARVTGLSAREMLGTREPWRAFWNRPRKIFSQRVLEDSACLDNNNFAIKLADNCVCAIFPVDRVLEGKNAIWNLVFLEKDGEGKTLGCWQIFQPIIIEDLVFNKRLLQIIINKIPVPTALLIDNRLAVGNMGYARLLGLDSLEELEGKYTSDFLAESDRKRFIEANANGHQGIKNGNSYCWQYNIKGQTKYYLGQPTVFQWGKKKALLSTIRDITDQVLRERELREEKRNLENEKEELLKWIEEREAIYLGSGKHPGSALTLAAQMGKMDTNLVILGETGTGKSLLARIIHNISPRKNMPFVMVNCSAIPENLFESAFFGHVKGAFTGADKNRKGFLEQAHGGTLFLDEVGELTPAMQAKLLHAVELGKFTPVGGAGQMDVDVRFICATNRNFYEMLADRSLREDFFYRIFVTDIRLPPLRERKEELPGLIKFFLDKFSSPGESRQLSPEIMTMLLNHNWPGNVRELQNVILRYLAIGEIQLFSAQGKTGTQIIAPVISADNNASVEPLEKALERFEKEHILRALRLCGYNKVNAAQALGMNLRTFHRRCARFGLTHKFFPVPGEVQE